MKLSFLDLSPISAILKEFYHHTARIRHPPEAMLKLYALYKLKRFRYLTELWKQLTKKTLRLIGFKHRPSYKTLWHWLNKRIKPQGLEAIHTELLKIINQVLVSKDIRLAEQVVGDATQVEAKPQDEEAAYNGHYKTRCYMHACKATVEWVRRKALYLFIHKLRNANLSTRSLLRIINTK